MDSKIFTEIDEILNLDKEVLDKRRNNLLQIKQNNFVVDVLIYNKILEDGINIKLAYPFTKKNIITSFSGNMNELLIILVDNIEVEINDLIINNNQLIEGTLWNMLHSFSNFFTKLEEELIIELKEVRKLLWEAFKEKFKDICLIDEILKKNKK